MPPVMGFAQLPEVQPGDEERPVYAAGELLHAGIKGVAPRDQRRGLDDAGTGVGFHQAHEPGEARAAHHAVGIEHDHVTVVGAPAPAKIGDVATLALESMLAPAVEHMAETLHGAAQREPGIDLGDAIVGIAAVAEYEEVEVTQFVGARQRFNGGAQPGEDACDVFVADRHDHRSACELVDGRVGSRAGGNCKAVAAGDFHHKTHYRGPEAERDP